MKLKIPYQFHRHLSFLQITKCLSIVNFKKIKKLNLKLTW